MTINTVTQTWTSKIGSQLTSVSSTVSHREVSYPQVTLHFNLIKCPGRHVAGYAEL
jgi:hypothetical protein